MTALDRTFIEAFRRRDTESDRPQSPEKVAGEGADPAALAVTEAKSSDLSMSYPGWQWPPICDDLSRGAADGFDGLAAEIEERCSHGSRPVVALAGSQAGVGCTSVFLTLARTLAQRTSRPVLLIDANHARPALSARLQIVDTDAAPILLDGKPRLLGDDGIALASLAGAAEEIPATIAGFADAYPLVLIDAGCVGDSIDAGELWGAGVVGIAILVDYDDHDVERRNAAVEFLTKHSGMFLGVIETRREDLCGDVERPRLTG